MKIFQRRQFPGLFRRNSKEWALVQGTATDGGDQAAHDGIRGSLLTRHPVLETPSKQANATHF